MATRVTLPLLLDHHSHPLLYASFAQTVPLISIESKQAAERLIREQAERGFELVVANGWRSNLYQWSESELENLPPVAIFNVSLHSLKINRAGRSILRERFGEDVDKVDDQIWYEDHFRVVLNWFANLYASKEALVSFYDHLELLGVEFVEELLLIDEHEIDLFQQAQLDDRTRFWAAPDTYQQLSEQGKDQICGLKLFTDGAIGASTAAISRPYRGMSGPHACGRLIYTDEELDQTIDGCLRTGKALAVHAIGDIAIRQTVSILENHQHQISQVSEVRIEHAQLIDEETARRAKDLKIVLSMQPNFNADSVDYADRLDEGFCRGNNPFRTLIDQVGFVPGRDLVMGSDGMPHGIEFALQQSLFPSLSSQQLTIDEFQAGYCYPGSDRSVELVIDEVGRRVSIS